MAEMKVHIHHRWQDEESLMKRIARVVRYSDDGVKQQKDGYKWVLDYRSNDWWASGIQGEGKERHILISYRYGSGGNAAMFEAVRVFLEWELGPH